MVFIVRSRRPPDFGFVAAKSHKGELLDIRVRLGVEQLEEISKTLTKQYVVKPQMNANVTAMHLHSGFPFARPRPVRIRRSHLFKYRAHSSTLPRAAFNIRSTSKYFHGPAAFYSSKDQSGIEHVLLGLCRDNTQ